MSEPTKIIKYANGRIAKAGDIVLGEHFGCIATAVIVELDHDKGSGYLYTFGMTSSQATWPNLVHELHEQAARWIHLDDFKSWMAMMSGKDTP